MAPASQNKCIQKQDSLLQGNEAFRKKILARHASTSQSKRLDLGARPSVPFQWEIEPGKPKHAPPPLPGSHGWSPSQPRQGSAVSSLGLSKNAERHKAEHRRKVEEEQEGDERLRVRSQSDAAIRFSSKPGFAKAKAKLAKSKSKGTLSSVQALFKRLGKLQFN